MPIFASALPFPVSLLQNGFWVTPTLNPSWCIISRCKHLTSAFSPSVVIPEHLHFKKYYFIINYSPFISPLYWSQGIILRIVFKCVGSNIIYGSHFGGEEGILMLFTKGCRVRCLWGPCRPIWDSLWMIQSVAVCTTHSKVSKFTFCLKALGKPNMAAAFSQPKDFHGGTSILESGESLRTRGCPAQFLLC